MANLKDDKRDMEHYESNTLSSSCGESFKLFLKREFDYIIEISFTGETSQFINLIINKTIPFFIKKKKKK